MSGGNITDVLGEAIALSESDEMTRLLNKLRDKIPYTAPEMMWARWQEGTEIICRHCLSDNGNPQHKWQVEALSKWSAKPVRKICKDHNLQYKYLA